MTIRFCVSKHNLAGDIFRLPLAIWEEEKVMIVT